MRPSANMARGPGVAILEAQNEAGDVLDQSTTGFDPEPT